jgi:hypothetical protein
MDDRVDDADLVLRMLAATAAAREFCDPMAEPSLAPAALAPAAPPGGEGARVTAGPPRSTYRDGRATGPPRVVAG